MKVTKFLLALLCIMAFTSCKRLVKSFTKETTSEIVEKTTKEVSEEVVYGIGEKAIRRMDIDELIQFVRKNNGPLANSFEKLDKSTQKRIKEAIDKDVNFLNHLLCSNTLLDEFELLIKNAPNASKDINLLKMYAKSTFDARRYGKKNLFKELTFKEVDGVTIFIHKADNREFARLKDGIIELTTKETGVNNVIRTNIIDDNLIPNSVYKVRAENGASYIFNIDNYGRIHNVKFSGDIQDFGNIVKNNDNVFLGKEWNHYLQELSNEKKGSYSISFDYQDRGVSPEFMSFKSQKGKIRKGKIFQNINKAPGKVFSESENKAIIEHYAKQINIDDQKAKDLLNSMNGDDGLARLIHQNPEKNIQRWLNTRNPIDNSKFAVTSIGQTPRNAEVYAGNTYYFNPHLNEGLLTRMNEGDGIINIRGMDGLSYEDLLVLDKLYPDGVPFTKEGFPDFSKVAFKGRDGNVLSVNVGNIGESTKDIANANKRFKDMGYEDDGGYTWHHIENSTALIRVPFIIHGLVDHSGGISTVK